MAKSPTFEAYAKRGAFKEGIVRCDELLVKNPHEADLVITKFRLLCATTAQSKDLATTFEQLATVKPPLDATQLELIEDAFVQYQEGQYPPPLTTGPEIKQFWEKAWKAEVKNKVQFAVDRFRSSVLYNRPQDAQWSIDKLRQTDPKNRVLGLINAAYSQLSSEEKGDNFSRLALITAKLAVRGKYDDDKELDCSVVGQVFEKQESEEDIASIKDRPAFWTNKQRARKLDTDVQANGSSIKEGNSKNAKTLLQEEIDKQKESFSHLLQDQPSIDTLTELIINAINLFKRSTTDGNLGPRTRIAAEPCFLGVSGLVKLYELTGDSEKLLQAAFLAERLLQFDQHIHEARLILVYLYKATNLGSKAMSYFDSLNVKEVQFDTIGHVLFTNISLVRPLRASAQKTSCRDAHTWTQDALQIYQRHEAKLADCEASVLTSHGQAGMIFELNQLRTHLRDSLTQRMFVLEHRRVSRLSSVDYGKKTAIFMRPKPTASWVNFKDNRDFNATFNYGLNIEKALFPEKSGPRHDMVLLLAADTIWALSKKQETLVMDPDSLAELLTESSEPIAVLYHSLLRSLRGGEAGFVAQVKEWLAELQMMFEGLTIDTMATQSRTFFSSLDTLMVIHSACAYMETSGRKTEGLQEAKKQVHDSVKDLKRWATDYLKKMEAKHVMIENGVVTQELRKLDSKAFSFDDFEEDVKKSARENWQGFLKVVERQLS